MKLSNIFKKGANKVEKTKAQVIDKKQLEKVVGGTDTKTTTPNSIQDENKGFSSLIR